MEWIKLKENEEAPKENNILVFDEHGGIANAYFEENFDSWMIETFDGLYIRLEDKITHWMPLPSNPPK